MYMKVCEECDEAYYSACKDTLDERCDCGKDLKDIKAGVAD